MKNYIPGETKEERKLRKAREKAGLSLPQESIEVTPAQPHKSTKNKRYVVCLKHGNKYGPEYVNKLHNMVKRNLTLDYEFVCFTENSDNIDPEVTIMPLPEMPVNGWWYKPLFFNPDLELKGTILFLDLDIIIFQNIDKLFTYEPSKFIIIRDFNRHIIKNYDKFNSSVFRLDTGSHAKVYTDFIRDPKHVCNRFAGDQDWIRRQIASNFIYWPEEWIQSYKWEMRSKPRLNNKPRGQRDFESAGDPKIKENTSIAVFHGDPNPHICKDPWVIDNWK